MILVGGQTRLGSRNGFSVALGRPAHGSAGLFQFIARAKTLRLVVSEK